MTSKCNFRFLVLFFAPIILFREGFENCNCFSYQTFLLRFRTSPELCSCKVEFVFHDYINFWSISVWKILNMQKCSLQFSQYWSKYTIPKAMMLEYTDLQSQFRASYYSFWGSCCSETKTFRVNVCFETSEHSL